MSLRPLLDIVLVEETQEQVSKLFIPEGTNIQVQKSGIVRAVGEGVVSKLEEGDRVILVPLQFLTITYAGKKLLVCREKEVITRV